MGGYFFHSFWGLSESTIRSETGHIQIFNKGYEEFAKSDPWKYKISNFVQLEDLIKSDSFLNSHISVIAPELNFTGVVSNGEVSATFLGRAVNPEADRKLSSFGETISKGKKFIAGDIGVALLGEGLAQTISSSPPQSITILTTSSYSSMVAIDADIKGVTESFSEDYDDFALKIPLVTAWDMFGEELIDKVVILLHDTEKTEEVYQYLTTFLSEKGFDYEYKQWEELATYYQSVKRLYTNIFKFFSTIIMLFSLLFITSTLSIMILQRTYEIALLRSFGSRKRDVFKTFLLENITLGVVAGTMSILLSLLLIYIFNINGLETSPPPGSTREYVIKLRVFEYPYFLFQVWEFILCSTVVSSLYPALRGCYTNIISSLRKG